MDINKDILEVIRIMKTAAQKEIIPRFGKVVLSVKNKSGNFKESVTEADINSSKYILEFVRKNYLYLILEIKNIIVMNN